MIWIVVILFVITVFFFLLRKKRKSGEDIIKRQNEEALRLKGESRKFEENYGQILSKALKLAAEQNNLERLPKGLKPLRVLEPARGVEDVLTLKVIIEEKGRFTSAILALQVDIDLSRDGDEISAMYSSEEGRPKYDKFSTFGFKKAVDALSKYVRDFKEENK